MDPLLPTLVPMARQDDIIIARSDDLRRAGRRKDAAAAEVTAAVQASDKAAAEVKALRQAIAADEAELAHFRQQARNATRMLETGAGNPAAAERQLATCNAEIDRLETHALERMEALDTAEAARKAAVAHQAAVEGARAELAATDAPKVAAWQTELDKARADREALGASLPAGERGTWLQLLKRRDTATAWLGKDRACNACNRDVPIDVGARIERGELHVCVGCGRWLIAPAAAEKVG